METLKINSTSAVPTGCAHSWDRKVMIFHNTSEVITEEEFKKLPSDEKEQLHVHKVLNACSNCNAVFQSEPDEDEDPDPDYLQPEIEERDPEFN